MNHQKILDFLTHAEEVTSKKNGELPPPDLNTLRDIETNTVDPEIQERIKNIRRAHDHWTEFAELPEDWESDPHG